MRQMALVVRGGIFFSFAEVSNPITNWKDHWSQLDIKVAAVTGCTA